MRSEFTHIRFIHVILGLLIVTGPHLTHANVVRTQSASTVEFDANAVAQVLVYGYPLIAYVKTFYSTLVSKGANVLDNDNTTSTASGASLVRPNADYVYSRVAVDLSHKDVVITLPNVTDGRSFVFPFYDLYGNNFANLGSVGSSPPGDYLMRSAGDRACGVEIQDNSFSEYKGIVYFPTVYGSMEIRILLRKIEGDLDIVHHIQGQIFTRLEARSGPPIGPSLTPALLQNGALAPASYSGPDELNTHNATLVLDLLAALTKYNPPQNPSDVKAIRDMLAAAGIKHGSYRAPHGLNMTLVNQIIGKNLLVQLTPPMNYDDFGNGWLDFKAYFTGNFHTNYWVRAYIAFTGYLQLVETQAIYPEYIPTGTSILSVTGNQSYIFTFSKKPPSAFWSLTTYGANNYLIPNSFQRYSLGATSNITYANGALVYENSTTKDDAFQLLIQPADVTPPSNWTANWIPAPAGGGMFSVNFRMYGPYDAATNGSYVYPVVTKQGAL